MLPALFQDELFSAPPGIVDAMSCMAEAPAEKRGAVHTRPDVAAFILELIDWPGSTPLTNLRFLEPSAGEGDFLLPAAESLLKRMSAGATEKLRPMVRAVEVNRASLAICRSRLETLFREHGWKERHFAPVLDDWLVQADFLTVTLPTPFTHIAGNPPYIRLEHLPKELLAAYRARWSTLFDRADLYVAFFEKCLGLLSPEGRLGFICADRWMKNRYGGPLRKLVATRGYHLDIYVDFTSCPVFQEEVDAYPAVTVLRKGQGEVTKAAFRPEVTGASLSTLARALIGNSGDPRIRSLGRVSCSDQPWMFDEHGTMAVLRRLESRLPTLEAAGCRVGIGVATGADAVFIGKKEDLDVEPQRRLPLVTTRDIKSGKVEWGGNWVLNPFEDDGSPVDLAAYPRFRAYVERHRQAIAKRNVAQKNKNAWYRTIDRIHPDLTLRPKLLIPDIKGNAHVVMEEGRLYPHHNLYYVTANTWDLRALRTVLSSRLGRAFVSAYSPGMRGGFLRFQAQYLRRIRIPRWEEVDSSVRRALIAAEDSDTALCELYKLTHSEWKSLAVPAS